MSKLMKAEGPFPPSEPGQPQSGGAAPPEPESGPAQALGASALLDAWKVRESVMAHPAKPPLPAKPPPSPVRNNPGTPETIAPPSGPAAPAPRRLAVFALWFGVIAAATGWGGWLFFNADPFHPPGTAKPDAARTGAVELASGQLVLCPVEPVVPVAGAKDGQLPMQADVSGLIAADIDSFVILGKEALASGRERDAEVALLMSCRIADTLKGAASVESADAKFRLGAHYAGLNLREGPATARHRAELLARAEILYADSLLTYSARFGDDHEKSRLAAERLASVRLALAQNAQPAPAVVASPGGQAAAGADKLPGPPLPRMAAKPVARPLPAIEAGEKIRPASPVVRECPPAVETLGLCNPAS